MHLWQECTREEAPPFVAMMASRRKSSGAWGAGAAGDGRGSLGAAIGGHGDDDRSAETKESLHKLPHNVILPCPMDAVFA